VPAYIKPLKNVRFLNFFQHFIFEGNKKGRPSTEFRIWSIVFQIEQDKCVRVTKKGSMFVCKLKKSPKEESVCTWGKDSIA
jgi:hypothetical protein